MVDTVRSLALDIVEQAIIGEPRSQQRIIGPSEIGTACAHCLAAKLANWDEVEEAAWLPWTGTAIHAQLERVFEPLPGWLTETRVSVGRINGVEIKGTADLFHVPTGTVADWKYVGTTTHRNAKKGPSPVYRRQAHLYGLGFLRAGFDVKRVAICYLPRNGLTVRQSIWWEEDFDPTMALDALDRATSIAQALDAFPTIEERDEWITHQPRDPDCFSCTRYADWATQAPNDSLEALLGV